VGPSRELLAELGFRVGETSELSEGPLREPLPVGRLKTPYFNAGDYLAYVHFYAAWAIECTQPPAREIAFGPGERPIVILRRLDPSEKAAEKPTERPKEKQASPSPPETIPETTRPAVANAAPLAPAPRGRRVVVIGDTCFALNKNLEHEQGLVLEQMRDNAQFWRWLLSILGERQRWFPPKPEAP
jgi:hypothetical protein